ncbi:uncharacterized protein [Linepithema humile]|uniref:uncharacterized protein n=1 Tax=Linepithema humile TaxID=83485 RepID=UPI0006236657|nr:PREDICTED: uncharacterized protein LOC105677096 [Linepithema humile]XP_012230895.1 PREDICTED: uncharacterized protein LOC105677096 [Linepithema humile]XP_012230896.1 PREDICTED: uncharacterized protein LOC105677096 [Linepithema humile]XP_012230897.1 PREDICTED: uncharacterized protein LOC105677096 [Linepithema humile]XP_012230898.1 PREDICTED: uncharacterized protein LOC105677096 [Linepithema humile]
MEDEDFGFASRTDNALKKILTVSNERANGEEAVRNDKPKTSEVVGGGGGSTTPAPPTVAGSEGRERASTAAGSVVPNTPDIPNVVEYHLKVKPRSTTRHCRPDNAPRDQLLEEMKKEKSPVSVDDKRKDLVSKLSRLSIDNNVFEGSTDLPQVFQVKYLGSHDARGLWGIKHTRRPVDNMVSAAKALPTNTMLPLIKLVVSQEGVALLPLDKRKQDANLSRMYPIETISYGVQDLVYTRVFSMIVVRETENFRRISPFECHGFVCESKYYARQLTYALATAFEIYSKTVKAQDKLAAVSGSNSSRKRFAIDLRSPEEIEADLTMDSEA